MLSHRKHAKNTVWLLPRETLHTIQTRLTLAKSKNSNKTTLKHTIALP